MSIRLYVGNLSKDIQRQDFESIFAEYGEDLVSVKLISDKKTGKCRGFGFVTVKTEEKADEIVEKLNGQLVEDTPLKIEKGFAPFEGQQWMPKSQVITASGVRAAAPVSHRVLPRR
jgi:RNA recognition motif-containing protein